MAKRKGEAGGCAAPGALSTYERNLLPPWAFALERERKYPLYVPQRTRDGRLIFVPSGSHASNAKARASQGYAAGRLSFAQLERINRKADAVLRKCSPRGSRKLEEALRKAAEHG